MNNIIEYKGTTTVVLSSDRQLKRIAKLFCFLIILNSLSSCKKFIQTDVPYTSISSGNIYTTDATAASVLTGIYAKLGSDNSSSFKNGLSGVSLLSGLSSDEIRLFNLNDQSYFLFYSNSLSASSTSACDASIHRQENPWKLRSGASLVRSGSGKMRTAISGAKGIKR